MKVLWVVFFRLVVRLIALIPLNARVFLGRLLGSLVALVPSRDQKIASLQLKKIYGNRPSRPPVTRVYAHLGRVALESLNLWPILKNPDRFPIVHNAELVERCKQTGALALTAHFGNWDLLAASMVQLGVPVNAIARKARKADFQDLLTDLRTNYGIQSLWRENSKSLKTIIQCLKDKQIIAALVDQDTRVSSLHSSFFGIKAKTPSGLVVLARRLEVPIVSAFCAVSRTGRYEVWVEEFDSDLDAQQVLDEFHQRLEDIIIRFPEQWVWFHKRWRTGIDQHTMSSKEYMNYLESM